MCGRTAGVVAVVLGFGPARHIFIFLCTELQICNYPSDYIRHYIKPKLLQLTLSYLAYVGGLQTNLEHSIPCHHLVIACLANYDVTSQYMSLNMSPFKSAVALTRRG